MAIGFQRPSQFGRTVFCWIAAIGLAVSAYFDLKLWLVDPIDFRDRLLFLRPALPFWSFFHAFMVWSWLPHKSRYPTARGLTRIASAVEAFGVGIVVMIGFDYLFVGFSSVSDTWQSLFLLRAFAVGIGMAAYQEPLTIYWPERKREMGD